MPHACPYCGMMHGGTCYRVKAIEYYQDGTVKRVELHEQKTAPPLGLTLYPSASSTYRGTDFQKSDTN